MYSTKTSFSNCAGSYTTTMNCENFAIFSSKERCVHWKLSFLGSVTAWYAQNENKQMKKLINQSRITIPGINILLNTLVGYQFRWCSAHHNQNERIKPKKERKLKYAMDDKDRSTEKRSIQATIWRDSEKAMAESQICSCTRTNATLSAWNAEKLSQQIFCHIKNFDEFSHMCIYVCL